MGHLFDEAMAQQIIADLNDTRIKRRGLSLSGGDPLHPNNVGPLIALVRRVRAECPQKDIWLWTGFVLAEMTPEQRQLVALVDVFIDGKFEQDLASPNLPWRGSSNQVMYQNSELGPLVIAH